MKQEEQMVRILREFPKLWGVRQTTYNLHRLSVVNAEHTDALRRGIVIPGAIHGYLSVPELVFSEVWLDASWGDCEFIKNVTPAEKCGLAHAALKGYDMIKDEECVSSNVRRFSIITIKNIFLLQFFRSPAFFRSQEETCTDILVVRFPKKMMDYYFAYLVAYSEEFKNYLATLNQDAGFYSGIQA